MKFYKIILLILVSIFFTNCEQKITVQKHKLTGINPVAYTDVIFNSSRDTVFVSTFDGRIYEIINNKENRRQIAKIDDEIYNLAYNAKKNEIYAATLNSGVVIINASKEEEIRKLPIKETWAYQLCYNEQNGILATFDFKGGQYVWDTENEYKSIEVPKQLNKMRPKYITDNGNIYFDGHGKLISWNHRTSDLEYSNISGNIVDIDTDQNILLIKNKEFSLYSSKEDSLLYNKQHPNWPIYLPDKDSIVNVPLSLEIISGFTSNKFVYTFGLDKSIRKWGKSTGKLIQTYNKHRGTISGVDINDSKNQMVTVDLLGKIIFWEM